MNRPNKGPFVNFEEKKCCEYADFLLKIRIPIHVLQKIKTWIVMIKFSKNFFFEKFLENQKNVKIILNFDPSLRGFQGSIL